MTYLNEKNYKTKSFNLFWKFLKLPIDANLEDVFEKIHLFKRVSIPHDWLIYDVNHLYETSSGWYVKEVSINKKEDRIYQLYFEGVYNDSTVYVNQKKVGSWKNGYTSFEMDITNDLVDGDNTIIVQVKHQYPNSRWYSGAGIYRNIWWIEKTHTHLETNGIYVSCKAHGDYWTVDIETNVHAIAEYALKQSLYDHGELIKEHTFTGCQSKAKQLMEIKNPSLWSPAHPHLYHLVTTLIVNGVVMDQYQQKIGFKHIIMNAEKGLFINGKKMKIHGVCEHHDLGSMGAAFSKILLKNRMTLLKEMGVNAIRTAHSTPSPDLMDLADKMGFLVQSEAFDMWERSKNPYDYARFFKTWVDNDVKSWVTRDRNHVSLFMWSIGNEIYDTHVDEHGLDITKQLVSLVKKFDPKGNGAITFSSNFMMGELTQKCADVMKVVGYNYGEAYYEEHHKKYPEWKIYGSETSSILQSRGIYHFPLSLPILVDDDQQCSALGNSIPSWGAQSLEKVITYDRDLPFSMGQFIWTGFDYLGEPTPYDTVNSYFGQIDTAGFKKDSYYVYQAAWTNSVQHPMIHIFPYWHFNEGEMIDVRVCTNAHHFELYLDDQLLVSKQIDMTTDKHIIPTLRIPFKSGVLKAIAYNKSNQEIATDVKHTFSDSTSLNVYVDKKNLQADGKDLLEITVTSLDKNKNIVENSNLPIKIEVNGPAKVLGIDNGDSTDYQAYKGYIKNMFSGKLKILLGATYEAGDVTVKIHSPKLDTKIIHIKAETYCGHDEEIILAKQTQYNVRSGEVLASSHDMLMTRIPIRSISLFTDDPRVCTKDYPTFDIKASVHPMGATKQDLIWQVVSEKGIVFHLAELKPHEGGCLVTAKGDGKFIVRCMAKNNKKHPDVISNLLCEAQGIGTPYKNPYDFIIAGLYDDAIGDIKAGQEQGVAFNQPGDTVVFNHIDFGKHGSNNLTLSIFSFESKPLEIKVYDGNPKNQDSKLIDILHYGKETIWNLYQDETYQLRHLLKGVRQIAFEVNRGVHFKGFKFSEHNSAYDRINILSCDEHYGDSFHKETWGFSSIGNNVAFKFEDIRLDKGVSKIQICGYAPKNKNSIRLQYRLSDHKKQIELIEFEQSDDFVTRVFDLKPFAGNVDVEFIFLPGSNFNFKWFKFIK